MPAITRAATAAASRPKTSIMVLAAAFLLLSLALSSRANASVYWASFSNSAATVGIASNDGTAVNQAFITDPASPCAVASDGAHVYWAALRGSIGRANLDGTGVNPNFITGVTSCALAIDATHVYWANLNTGSIGRASLDGTHVNSSFIPSVGATFGVAIDQAHIYWSTFNTVGRANLDGTNANQNFMLFDGLVDQPCGVAVDAAHVYWANDLGTIGRANLNGTGANANFVQAAPAGSFTCGVAVDSAHLYWAQGGDGVATASDGIGRANLDGTGINQTFIATPQPMGVAVDAGGQVDTVAPTATVTVAAYQTALTNRLVSWSAKDPAPSGGGPFLFDAQRRLGINSFGSFGTFLGATTATSATFSGNEGETHCIRARATDGAGNTGGFGAAHCTGFPTDDAHATAMGFTHQGSLGVNYYLGTRSASNSLPGSTLTTTSFTNVKRVGLVYDAQPGGATVTISINGMTACTVHTANATLQHQRVASCPPFATAQTGRIVVTQTSTGPLTIDGIGHRLQ
jgi:virginiamycin B lyase